MATLASLVVKLLLDAAEFKAGIGGAVSDAEQASQKFQKIGSSLTGAGKSLTIGATLPLVGLGVVALNAASDMEESLSKVRVIFGDSAGEIEAWASTAAESFGQSSQQALEAAGTYGNLFTALGIGGEDAQEMSTTFVELAGDLASFNNASPEETLLALRSALVGEFEPMRRFGTALNQAAIEAKAMELGLMDVGGELTPAAKAQAAYALILEQTTAAQGDFQRTADGQANSARIAKAEFLNVAAALGQQLLPIVTQITQFVTGLMQGFMNLSPTMQTVIVVIGAIVAIAGPLLLLIGGLITAIGAIIPVIAAIGAPLLLIIAIIALFAAQIALLYLAWKNNWFGIQDKVKVAIDFVKSVIQAGLTFVQNFWKQHGETIMATARAMWENIKSVIDRVLGIIRGIFDAFALAFQGDWHGFGEKLRETFFKAWELITDIIRNAWDNWKILVQALVRKFIDFVKNTDWKQVGIDIIHGIGAGITAAAQFIQNIIRNVLNAAIEAAKGLLGIDSPSKVFMKMGEQSMEGYALGLGQRSPVIGALKDLTASISGTNLSPTRGMMGGQSVVVYGPLVLQGVTDKASLFEQLRIGA